MGVELELAVDGDPDVPTPGTLGRLLDTMPLDPSRGEGLLLAPRDAPKESAVLGDVPDGPVDSWVGGATPDGMELNPFGGTPSDSLRLPPAPEGATKGNVAPEPGPFVLGTVPNGPEGSWMGSATPDGMELKPFGGTPSDSLRLPPAPEGAVKGNVAPEPGPFALGDAADGPVDSWMGDATPDGMEPEPFGTGSTPRDSLALPPAPEGAAKGNAASEPGLFVLGEVVDGPVDSWTGSATPDGVEPVPLGSTPRDSPTLPPAPEGVDKGNVAPGAGTFGAAAFRPDRARSSTACGGAEDDAKEDVGGAFNMETLPCPEYLFAPDAAG